MWNMAYGIVNRILANPATSWRGDRRPGCTWRWCLAGGGCSCESDWMTPRFVPKHRRGRHVEHGLRDCEPNSGESGYGLIATRFTSRRSGRKWIWREGCRGRR